MTRDISTSRLYPDLCCCYMRARSIRVPCNYLSTILEFSDNDEFLPGHLRGVRPAWADIDAIVVSVDSTALMTVKVSFPD
jgi:hypothetical protein